MPNWKKLLSSGSSGSLAHLSVDTSVEATSFTGSLLSTNGVISGSSQVDITQASGYTTFSSSIQTYTDDKVASLVDSAPGTLDTLNELAAALNDDPNFSASIATTIGTKLATATFNTYSSSAAPALRTEYVAGDNALSSSTATALRAEYVAGDSALSASAHTQRVALYEINSASIAALDGDFATDSELNNLSASVDAHLDANILALSASVDTHLDANISSLSSSAHTARVDLSGSQKTYIDAKVAGLVDSAPATLDTLNELAAALNDDPNFSASIATSIGNRVLTSTFNTYSGSAAGAFRTEYNAGDAALSSSAHTQRVAIASSIPTNNNQLTNGAGYITSADGGNANLLDGIDSTGFVKQLADLTSGAPDYQTPSSRRVDPNAGNPTNEHYAIITFGNNGNVTGQLATHFVSGLPYTRGYNNSWSAWRKIWTDANDGAGSGLDADTLDGLQATSFLRSDTSDTMNGTLNVTGDVVAYYTSDGRLKDNLVPIGNALEKVKQLTGYEFDWNDKQDVYEGHDIGVVAQEVEKVLPEVVTTRDNGYKAVKYEKLVALLIQSNKELIERVELLEKQLNVK